MSDQLVEHLATFKDGRVELEDSVRWPSGTKLIVRAVDPLAGDLQVYEHLKGHVIIVGFGLAGRCIAEQLVLAETPFVIIERNPDTIATQKALGRHVVQGSAVDAQTLLNAGLQDAAILALTIPDEDAVLEAISLARRYRPDLYIIARTNYSSKGMRASQLGANEVIKAEQAVAIQFHERLKKLLRHTSKSTTQG